jgi:hypothetical protein
MVLPRLGIAFRVLIVGFSIATLVIATGQTSYATMNAVGINVTAMEGVSFTQPAAGFGSSRAGAVESEFTATIDWGDATTTAGTIIASGGGFAVEGTHTYAEEGSLSVAVTITDTVNSDTANPTSTATIGDAPLVGVGLTFTPVEGVSYTGPVAAFGDGNTNPDISDFSATIDWGDLSPTTAGTIIASGAGFAVEGPHTYAEEGSFSVTATINDAGGSTTTANSTANVADAPLTAVGTTIKTNVGTPFSGVVATFTDANPNPDINDFSASINWGDSSPATPGSILPDGSGGFRVLGAHTYAQSGLLTVTVTISDVGGSTATAITRAVVAFVAAPALSAPMLLALIAVLTGFAMFSMWGRRPSRE